MLDEYAGPERRRHKTYVTRNTEYHFRDQLCVAVRDRRSGSWLPAHLALQRRLGGTVKLCKSGVAIPSTDQPRVGEALFFDGDGRELVTSSVCAVERPQKVVVESYPEPSAFVRPESD